MTASATPGCGTSTGGLDAGAFVIETGTGLVTAFADAEGVPGSRAVWASCIALRESQSCPLMTPPAPAGAASTASTASDASSGRTRTTKRLSPATTALAIGNRSIPLHGSVVPARTRMDGSSEVFVPGGPELDAAERAGPGGL